MIKNGELADADDVINNLIGITFKNQAQLLYNSAYIGFNSKLNVATGAPNLKNISYNCMLGDNVTYFSGMEYDGTNKLYKSQDNTTASADYFIDIYTTTTTGISALAINNCVTKCLKNSSTEKIYRLYCTTGTAEVKRAQILKTLFYGSNGTDYKVTGITGLTALKTSDSNDVGMRFNTIAWAVSGLDNSDFRRTGTFSNTTTNLVSSWSSVSGNYGSGYAYWDVPVGTTLNGGANNYTVDVTGTDQSSNEKTNPANCECRAVRGTSGNSSFDVRALIGWKSGTLTWSDLSYSGSGSETLWALQTFSTIPALTLANYNKDSGTFLEFQSNSFPTILDIIPTWNSLIDADNTLTVSISADGTNYEEVTDATIHRFTNTGTNLYVKFEINRVDTSAVDKISEYAILYNVGAA